MKYLFFKYYSWGQELIVSRLFIVHFLAYKSNQDLKFPCSWNCYFLQSENWKLEKCQFVSFLAIKKEIEILAYWKKKKGKLSLPLKHQYSHDYHLCLFHGLQIHIQYRSHWGLKFYQKVTKAFCRVRAKSCYRFGYFAFLLSGLNDQCRPYG